MPPAYYAICAPEWLRQDVRELSPAVRSEIAPLCRRLPHASATGRFDRTAARAPCSRRPRGRARARSSLQRLLEENGFDPELHEQIRADLRTGRIGLAQNRLPAQHGHRRRSERRRRDRCRWRRQRPQRRRPPAGPTGAGRGRGGRADLGRRGGQPLDPRGGRGQGPAPLLPLPRPLPQLHRDPPGQEPPHRRSLSAPTCRTSSPPAT